MRKPLHFMLLTTTIALLAWSALAQAGAGQKTPAPTGQKSTAAAPQNPPAAPTPNLPSSPFKTEKEKASYAIGLQVGGSIARQSVDVDPDVLLQGIKDAIAGKPVMSDEEVRATMTQLQNEMRARQEIKAKAASEANKKEGDAFMAANKSKEGVVTLPSGLQYKVLKAGTGPKPTASDSVVCNYRGTLINGKEFDSSYKRGEPATFPVGGVIKGWTEALQLMPVGSKWQLFIPPSLAYGDRGAGADIGPDATLIFEVELLSIAPKK